MAEVNPAVKAWRFYRDGFRGMGIVGKQLWLIIGLKLFIMFAVLKAFFFPNHIKQEAERLQKTKSEVVQDDLIDRGAEPQGQMLEIK